MDPNYQGGYQQPQGYAQGGYQQQGGYPPQQQPGGWDQQPQQGYQQQQPPHQQPPPPQGDHELAQLLNPQSQQPPPTHQEPPPLHIEKTEGLMPREVFDHDKYDIEGRADIEGINDMRKLWKMQSQTVLETWVLFNAVTTIMIITTGFKRGVQQHTRVEFGESGFDAITDIIIYFPLVFFAIIYLLFNNFYSERTFYMYLKKGVLIDFPESAGPKFLFTHPLPLLVIVVWFAYCIFAMIFMIKFGARPGVIFIFLNNMVVGIGFMWYRQQSIEYRFVSLSNFIQSFPDRTGAYGNMDEQSLHSAANYLKDVVLTESNEASYRAYMRLFYWKNKRFSTPAQILHHGMIFIIVFGLAGISVAYFVIVARLDIKTAWETEIMPCIASCGSIANRLADVRGNPFPQSFLPLVAGNCTCSCLEKLNYKDATYREGCGEYFTGPDAGLFQNTPGRCPAVCSDWFSQN